MNLWLEIHELRLVQPFTTLGDLLPPNGRKLELEFFSSIRFHFHFSDMHVDTSALQQHYNTPIYTLWQAFLEDLELDEAKSPIINSGSTIPSRNRSMYCS